MNEAVLFVAGLAIAGVVGTLGIATVKFLLWRRAERRRREAMERELKRSFLECSRWENF